MVTKVSIVEDFHPFPAGRYLDDGAGNGTSFREEHLLPALKKGDIVEVDLDGAPGYPSSFLEEAFGGLVRQHVPEAMIREHLRFHASKSYERYVDKIWTYIKAATIAAAAESRTPDQAN